MKGKLNFGRDITNDGTKFIPDKIGQLRWEDYIEDIPKGKEGSD